MRFDLAILGDTAEAWAAADAAAGRGLRTAVLRPVAGSRVAAVAAAYADDDRLAFPASPAELVARAVARRDAEIDRRSDDAGPTVLRGGVRLTGPHTAETLCGGVAETTTADRLLIAVGIAARRPRGVAFDGRTILLPEDVAELRGTPRTVAVLGGGRTATAYARLFAAAGSQVARVTADVLAVRRGDGGAAVLTRNGSDGRPTERTFDAVLFAGNRVGATAALHLAAAGLESDDEGRLWCDGDGRTWVPHVAAVGEVVGFPSDLCDDVDAPERAVAALCGLPAAAFAAV